MTYIRKLAFFIICCFLLSGCWDRSELSKNTIVTGIGIDKGDNTKFKLVLESTAATELNPSTAQGNAPAFIMSLEGNTVGEVIHKYNIAASTHYIFSHMRLLVISEDIAKEGVAEFIDFFDRDREIRDDFNIVLVKNGTAEDLLKITNDYQKVSSLKIFPQLDNMLEEWGGTPGVKLNEFIRTYVSKGKVPVLAAMEAKGNKEMGNSIENIKQVVQSEVAKIDSLGVFKKGRLIDYISLDETRLMNWVQNKLKQTIITVPLDDKDHYFALRVYRTKTHIEAKKKEGRPHFKIDIYSEAALEGVDQKAVISKINAYTTFEKKANQWLKENLLQLIHKMQNEDQADIFGFGEIMRDQDYKNFKQYEDNWDQGFKDSQFEVNVHFEIKRSGFRNNTHQNTE